MINAQSYNLGSEPSAIRQLFTYGMKRKAEIGGEKVFDFSLGNPSIPAPIEVKKALQELIEEDPAILHAYSPSAGLQSTREVVARSIKQRFNINAKPEQVYMTEGAAAGIAISLTALTMPGEEVIVPAPYFPEYKVWIERHGCTMIPVLCTQPDFQLDIESIQKAITPKTSAIIINSPNNPTGSIYSYQNFIELFQVLQSENEHRDTPVYCIVDEPYREITYGSLVPYIPCLYDYSVVCYSYSKSLSLPGERIGYVYVNNNMSNAQDVMYAIQGAGRSLGYVCANVLFQRVLERCIDCKPNIHAYRENRSILLNLFSDIGYEFSQPEGAFYLWVKSLEPDAIAFSERAKEYELLLVPSDSFGCPGYVRISYCVDKQFIESSKSAFVALWDSYYL